MGMSAKNIVLVGDQMQLGQPIQGSHPGSSGMSTLEYLLQDKPTIAPIGVFSLRQPGECMRTYAASSHDAVYDGQLHPEKDNQNQALILSDNAHPCLMENGIQFIPAQSSRMRTKKRRGRKDHSGAYI